MHIIALIDHEFYDRQKYKVYLVSTNRREDDSRDSRRVMEIICNEIDIGFLHQMTQDVFKI